MSVLWHDHDKDIEILVRQDVARTWDDMLYDFKAGFVCVDENQDTLMFYRIVCNFHDSLRVKAFDLLENFVDQCLFSRAKFHCH